MRSIALIMTATAILSFMTRLHAQTWQMPPDNQRCPSKWGAGDQRGSGNLMKPETVLRAAKLIKTGEVFELGAVLSPDPKETFINGGRVFNIYTKPSLPAPNERRENEELVVTELGQIGTQFDAFAHQMWGDSFYNCFKLGDIGTRSGFKKLGVEHVGALMTRGVLIDVAGLKGVDMLPTSYIITPEDLRDALAKVGQKIEPGDAVNHPHRLVEADGQGESTLRHGQCRHRHRRRAVAGYAGPDAGRRRQLLRRGAPFGAATQPAGARDDADPARHLSPGEPGAGGVGISARR